MPYGIVLIGLMAAAFIAAIMGVSAFSQETVEGLKTGLMYGLPINLGMMALLTLLEFVLPAAGQRKPLKKVHSHSKHRTPWQLGGLAPDGHGGGLSGRTGQHFATWVD